MATYNYSVGPEWTNITEAGTSSDFILQNLTGGKEVHVRFDTTTPAAGDPYHVVGPRGSFIRAGVSGSLYVRSATSATVYLSISAAV